MVEFKGKRKRYRPIVLAGIGILLLLASVTLLPAALQNWAFTTASNYTFDSVKIDISDGVAKLKPVAFIHDEEAELSGTHSNTRWATDHIELNSTGLSSGSGTYTSQTIDSGAAGTQWGKISWTEVLTQNSASFSPTKSVGSLSTGSSVFGTDIDGDDDIDVVVVQGNSPRVHYFENDGSEAFTSRTVDAVKPRNAEDLHVADINKDGRQDVVVIGKSDLFWFENLGGTPPQWKRRAITPKPSTGLEVEAADVNGDGNLDIVIGDDSNVKWYENNGANPPSWTAQAVDSTLSLVDALSAGDLDGDGDLDLLAGDESGLYWYENNGANPPLFTKRNIDTTIVNTESVMAADLNKDGKMDVVGVGLNGLNLSWYENDGSSPPGFTKWTVDSGPLTSPVSVSAGDLDRDGNMDLVLTEGADVHWYRNGGGQLPGWVKRTLTNGTVGGGDHLFLVNLLDDVNGDDDLDIVVAENNQVSWWENLLPHSNIRFQLRTSTDGSIWSSWQGPGGRTTSSYTDPTGETIIVPNGRYIQYRAFLRTHNGNSLNAQLSMVRLDPANVSYPTDNPTVQNVTGQDFTSISSFTETLGGGNKGVVKYQISNDGTVWYYHSGSLWVPAAQGFTHANTAAEVNSNSSSFDDDVGAGTFFFKAFLNSDGTQQVELDQIQIDSSTVGAPAQLVFSVQPSSAEVNAVISPAIKVQLQDASGKLVTTATDSITLAIGTNPGGSSLGGTLTVAAVGGEVTFNNVSIDKTGTGYTLTAASGSLTSSTSSAFNVTAGAASKLVFSVQPSSAEVNASISPAIKVQVQDAYGNLVTTATNSVTLAVGTNPGGATLGGTLTVAAVGGEATFNNVSIDKVGSGYTLVASAAGLTSATSSAFNVTAGAPSKLVFSVQPSDAVTGATISPAIKVQLQDASGNLVTTATNSITLAIGTNPGSATLAGTLALSAVGGEATFSNISIDKAGSGYTFIASASGLTSATSAALNVTENVTESAATKLAFVVQPSNAEANATISPTIKVEVQDANGNLVTTATNSVTLAVGTNPGGATLGGTLTVAAVGGEATFNSISIDKAGIGYTLVASASGLISATSSSFNVTPASANKLVFTVQPSSALPNATISPAIKVQVQDADGNLVTTATDPVTLAMGSNSGGANIAGTLTLAAVGGEATFSVSLDKAGSGYTLVASAPGLTSATSAAFYITAALATTSQITAVPTSIVADGVTTSTITVQLKDINSNNLNSGGDTVALATDLGTLGSVTNNGNGTYTATLTSATTTGTAIITGTLNEVAITDTATITLTPGVADATNQLVFTVQPSSAEANAVISPAIKVQVQDANGNLITNATDAVTLAIGSNSGGAELAGTTSVGAVGGEATFSNISIDKAGSDYTLVASASGLTSATSAAFNITAALNVTENVTESAATQLAFVVQPSSAEAYTVISPAIKVQVQNASGKLVSTSTTITLAIGSSSGGAKIAGTSSKTAVGGEATFSNISIDKAGNGYTLVASASGLISATSTSFNITGGTAKKLAFSVQPSNAEVGVAISPAIKVQVQDAGGNLVSTAKDSITLAIGTNPGGSTLSGTLTVVAVGGEATFSDSSLDKSSSGYTLVASASGLTSATSAGFGITAGQQLASGGSGVVPATESAPLTETVTQLAKQEAEADKKAEDSEQETGATSPEKTSTPEKVAAKPTNKSRASAKSILEDTATAVPQVLREVAELNAEISPVILNRETEVAAGETVTIQFRADSGLAPEIDLYDANNVQLVTAAVMTEVGNTGIYEYKLTLDTAWGSGEFTVVASESQKGSLNRMTLAVATATDTSVVQSQTDNGTSVVKSHTDTDTKIVRINPDTGTNPATIPVLLTDVQTKLNTIDTYLSKAVEGVGESPNTDAEATAGSPPGLELEPIQSSIREISELLKQVSSENGVNLDIMYGSIDESTGDVLELRDKVERLKVLLDLNREISEKVLEGSKKPLMKTWFESGSVILKILVVNPSKEESLTIPLKVYLPKEVSPEDIIDLGDLTLDFDTEKGMYTVHNEVTLEPGQSITKLVKMEDIWLFKAEHLSSIMDSAKVVARRLEETPYAKDAAVLFETIEKKIQAILKKQKETVGSPGEHIKAYRQGIIAITTIEQALSKLSGRLEQEFSKGELPAENLLAEGSVMESGEEVESEGSMAGLQPK